MKHPSSQRLFAHWSEKRPGASLPERRDIDPGALRGALGDVFILRYDPAAGHPFRLAGTRLCSLFSRELRQSAFLDLWDADGRAEIARLAALAADETVGVAMAGTGEAPGQAPIDLELTLFPLLHHGRSHSRLVGTLAAHRAPYWVGLHPLRALSLNHYRFLSAESGTPAPVVAPRPRVLTHEHLRVHQGGKR